MKKLKIISLIIGLTTILSNSVLAMDFKTSKNSNQYNNKQNNNNKQSINKANDKLANKNDPKKHAQNKNSINNQYMPSPQANFSIKGDYDLSNYSNFSQDISLEEYNKVNDRIIDLNEDEKLDIIKKSNNNIINFNNNKKSNYNNIFNLNDNKKSNYNNIFNINDDRKLDNKNNNNIFNLNDDRKLDIIKKSNNNIINFNNNDDSEIIEELNNNIEGSNNNIINSNNNKKSYFNNLSISNSLNKDSKIEEDGSSNSFRILNDSNKNLTPAPLNDILSVINNENNQNLTPVPPNDIDKNKNLILEHQNDIFVVNNNKKNKQKLMPERQNDIFMMNNNKKNKQKLMPEHQNAIFVINDDNNKKNNQNKNQNLNDDKHYLNKLKLNGGSDILLVKGIKIPRNELNFMGDGLPLCLTFKEFLELNKNNFYGGEKNRYFKLVNYIQKFVKDQRDDTILKNMLIPRNYYKTGWKDYVFRNIDFALQYHTQDYFEDGCENSVYIMLQFINYLIANQDNEQIMNAIRQIINSDNQNKNVIEKNYNEYQNNDNFDSLNPYITYDNKGNNNIIIKGLDIPAHEIPRAIVPSEYANAKIIHLSYDELCKLEASDFEAGENNCFYILIKYIENCKKGQRNDNMLKTMKIPGEYLEEDTFNENPRNSYMPAALTLIESDFAGDYEENVAFNCLQGAKYQMYKDKYEQNKNPIMLSNQQNFKITTIKKNKNINKKTPLTSNIDKNDKKNGKMKDKMKIQTLNNINFLNKKNKQMSFKASQQENFNIITNNKKNEKMKHKMMIQPINNINIQYEKNKQIRFKASQQENFNIIDNKKNEKMKDKMMIQPINNINIQYEKNKQMPFKASQQENFNIIINNKKNDKMKDKMIIQPIDKINIHDEKNKQNIYIDEDQKINFTEIFDKNDEKNDIIRVNKKKKPLDKININNINNVINIININNDKNKDNKINQRKYNMRPNILNDKNKYNIINQNKQDKPIIQRKYDKRQIKMDNKYDKNKDNIINQNKQDKEMEQFKPIIVNRIIKK